MTYLDKLVDGVDGLWVELPALPRGLFGPGHGSLAAAPLAGKRETELGAGHVELIGEHEAGDEHNNGGLHHVE